MYRERLLKKLARKFRIYPLYLLAKKGSYIREEGWDLSVRRRQPVDKDFNWLPWITYSAIDFILPLIKPEFSLFEFGCGGSTLFWAQRISKVISVEHDELWYKEINSFIPSNVDLHLLSGEMDDYSNFINNFHRHFDVIVIDGRDRVKCAFNSLSALKEDGMIIWDNTDRSRYSEGILYLKRHGLVQIRFSGLSPVSNKRNETSVFLTGKNPFFQPIFDLK